MTDTAIEVAMIPGQSESMENASPETVETKTTDVKAPAGKFKDILPKLAREHAIAEGNKIGKRGRIGDKAVIDFLKSSPSVAREYAKAYGLEAKFSKVSQPVAEKIIAARGKLC